MLSSDADVSGLTEAAESPGHITHEHAKAGQDRLQKHHSNKWLLQRTHQETPKPERKY